MKAIQSPSVSLPRSAGVDLRKINEDKRKTMNNSLIFFLILGLTLTGLVSVLILSISHFSSGTTCPTMAGIPACYILLVLVSGILISHLGWFDDRTILFFAGAGLSLIIAIIASVSQLAGWMECPKLFGSIPMCYLSFLLFGSIILLKLIEIKSG